jgi:hypothetical protein
MIIERNNCGAEVINSMAKTHKYPNLVSFNLEVAKNGDDLDKISTKDRRRGVYSNMAVKHKGVLNMRYWVNTLRSFDLYDLGTLHELKGFIRYPNGTWKAKPGKNSWDDKVDALLWALFILEEHVTERYFDVLEYDDQGKPLKIRNFHIESPDMYALDSFYQNDTNAPLPMVIGNSPTINMNDYSKESLKSRGWEEMKT